MNDAEYFKSVIRRLETCYLALDKGEWIGQPEWDPRISGFRHREKTDLTLIFLKGIRMVSLLNAAVVLLEAGHVHEMGILFRCIDESTEDAFLFSGQPAEYEQAEARRKAVLSDFFQEEFEDLLSPFPASKGRRRTPRKKVRSAIAGLRGNPVDPQVLSHTLGTIYSAYSGYVHGAYPHIMEMYGGHKPSYHMAGMRGTPRIEEWTRDLTNYVYRTVLVSLLVAIRLHRDSVESELSLLVGEMGERYPHIFAKDGGVSREVKARQRTRKRSRETRGVEL